MSETRKYTHVSPDHIRLVLKTKLGEKVKWPTEVKGPDHESHRRQIKDAAKKCKLEGGKLLLRISFTKTINTRRADGKFQNICRIKL